MLKFFPYIRDERNPTIGNADPAGTDHIEPKDLYNGLSKAAFLLNDNGTMYKMELLAEFAGIRQNPKTKALRPEITWAVMDTGEPPTPEMVKSYQEYKQTRENTEASKH